MRSKPMMWLEIEIEAAGDVLRAGARGSRGERVAPRPLAQAEVLDAFHTFTNKIGRAVRVGRALDTAVLDTARALHEELFQGELLELAARLGEAAKDGSLLVRLFLHDRALSAIPWEALCKPGTTEGFLGTDPRWILARGVHSTDPWQACEVRGAVRILAIAPGADERALLALQEALAPSIEAGEIEWLEPIVGPQVTPQFLYNKLRRGKTPHIVHFLGHGGMDNAGRPSLRMADDDDGEEVWITAEAFARELSACFAEDLRLVILEACEGAKSGAFGNAAEILVKAGADAVVAHLWPVKAPVARACSSEIYRSLTGSDRSVGDIGKSVAAARRTLLAESAEAFSPVLYLRGADSVVFDFKGRRLSTPAKAKRAGRSLAPALASLLERPHALVLGDQDEERDALRQELKYFMEENDDKPEGWLPLSALTQRCMLRFGQEVLHSLFQQTLATAQSAPPLLEALGAHVPPGVHVTLLWRPHLERAIAAKQPERTIYAIQPSFGGSVSRPRVVKRTGGASIWKMEPALPKRFDLENDIVVLRMYGGYSAEARPILSQPILTEDDHIHGLLGSDGLRPPQWMEELLARTRILPGLFMGLSILDWRHRMLLWWLYDQRPAPKDSLALLPTDADAREPEMWDAGGGLPGTGRIAALLEDFSMLAANLDALERGGEH